MKRPLILAAAFFATFLVGASAIAQTDARTRLPSEVLDVMPPTERVRGIPGRMAMRPLACRVEPISEVRKRIVDIAVQEWAFFGFVTVDLTDFDDEVPLSQLLASQQTSDLRYVAFSPWRGGGRFPPLPEEEMARVASSVAGYWAATPRGGTMIARQNTEWNGPEGLTGRWADPWSAAFISWTMCEAGLGELNQFQRAIAHWSYIDQAIRTRDSQEPQGAFAAFDLGEAEIIPGDLLCSGRRPAYRNIAQRRRQLGDGARTHCDIVVKVDEAEGRIYAVGGNVRRSVSLKIFSAQSSENGILRPSDPPEGADMRPLFAHLKLRADPISLDALDNSPTIKALDCELDFQDRHPAFNLLPENLSEAACR